LQQPDLVSEFVQMIKAQQLFALSDELLVAVSGGVDSVVLCDLLHRSGYNFTIAHCNFRLRGAESERDQDFVEKLAAKYRRNILVKRFDTAAYAEKHKVSIQLAARELRYDWFQSLIDGSANESRIKLKYLLTAHHADDNIETLLFNFFRGTGLRGLRGIMIKQDNVIRPLLNVRKLELLEYAKENKLEWVEDSSNVENKYSRNLIRNEIILHLKELFPDVEQNLLGNLGRFNDAFQLYEQAIEARIKKLLKKNGNDWQIAVAALKQAKPVDTILFEITRRFGFSASQLPDALQLMDAESGKFIKSTTHRLLKNRRWLIISTLQTEDASFIPVEEYMNELDFAQGKIEWSVVDGKNIKIDPSPSIALLNASLIRYPLLVRKWKQGDYFYPLGMRKKKKLARFFIDQKLSIADKERVWVIESNKKIVWVIGMRIDDRFKLTPNTKSVLRINFHRPTLSK
jgi:tRNA(Ile)-lysidine synthase